MRVSGEHLNTFTEIYRNSNMEKNESIDLKTELMVGIERSIVLIKERLYIFKTKKFYDLILQQVLVQYLFLSRVLSCVADLRTPCAGVFFQSVSRSKFSITKN